MIDHIIDLNDTLKSEKLLHSKMSLMSQENVQNTTLSQQY